MVRQAPVICVMVPPIHLGAWSMALMLWLPFELLLLLLAQGATMEQTEESGVLPYLEEKANYQQRHENTKVRKTLPRDT